MKKALLFFCIVFMIFFSSFERFQPVSLDKVQPTTKTVEIKGEVKNPGIYTVKYDATIHDVIVIAGGLLETANTDTINLARKVSNEEVIVISKIEEKEMELISINSATQEQLESLPGIGPSIASRIIEYRTTNPFLSLEDIKNVKGIGDKMFNKIKDYICL